MGNKSNFQRASKKAQARQILPTGQPHGVSVGFRQEDICMRIKLIQLNLAILPQVELNDFVIVKWSDSCYQCLIGTQILGNIPGNYNHELRPPQVHNATIVELNNNFPSVTIEINI